jgi:O-antigen/teichoic acid export membrane protein
LSAAGVVFSGKFPHALARVHLILIELLMVRWVIAAVLLVTAAYVFGSTLPWSASWTVALLLMLPLSLYEQLWVHLMVGTNRVVVMNVVQFGAGLLSLSLICIVVIGRGAGIAGALGVFGVVALAKALIMLLIAIRMTRSRGGGGDAPVGMKDIVWFGIRSYPHGLAAQLWSRLPSIVLEATHGSAILGIFSIAQQSIEQLLIPAQSAQDAIYQRITALPRDQATLAMNRYLRTFLLGMIPAGLICATLAPMTFGIVFGESFDGSATLFQILLISATFTVISALLSPYFLGQLQRPGLVSTLSAVRVVVALGLSVPLATQFAGVGLAWALVIADLFFNVLMLGLYLRFARTRVENAMVPRVGDLAVVYGRARALLQGLAP